jgi:hypothetical protein
LNVYLYLSLFSINQTLPSRLLIDSLYTTDP